MPPIVEQASSWLTRLPPTSHWGQKAPCLFEVTASEGPEVGQRDAFGMNL